MKRLRHENGQLIPMAAMVIFVSMMMLVAVVDVYRVARTQTKLQGLADGMAEAVAAYEARILNDITDKDEYLEHFYEQEGTLREKLGPSGSLKKAKFYKEWTDNHESQIEKDLADAMADPPPGWSEIPGSMQDHQAQTGYLPKSMGGGGTIGWGHPPISLAYDFTFESLDSAKKYAEIIKKVNEDQQSRIRQFEGHGGGAAGNALGEILKAEIPVLGEEGIHVLVSNSDGPLNQTHHEIQGKEFPVSPLRFETVDIKKVRYLQDFMVENSATGDQDWICCHEKGPESLSQLAGQQVGWMSLNWKESPHITVNKEEQIGAGVIAEKTVSLLLLGDKVVRARAKAYIVKGSGLIPGDPMAGEKDTTTHPVFSPSYIVRKGKW